MQFVDVPIIEQPRYNEDETSIETTRTKKQKIETIAKSYNIQLPDGIPYTQKRMVMIVGDQSSGKSSFINYLFGNLEVREVGARAVDSHVCT
jgi:ribosome biogenesis GTPase A